MEMDEEDIRDLKKMQGVGFEEEITVAQFDKEDCWSDNSKRPKITLTGKRSIEGSTGQSNQSNGMSMGA